MRCRRRGRDRQAAGAYPGSGPRSAVLGGLDQVPQPPLNALVEAFLGPAAEKAETPADQRAGDGRRAGVAADPEDHLPAGQVLDHLIAEAPLLQVTLQGLVAPAPAPLAAAAGLARLVGDT